MKRSFHGRSLKLLFGSYILTNCNRSDCHKRGSVSSSFLLLAFLLFCLFGSIISQAQTLSTLNISPTSVNGGVSSTGTVTLGANAPTGGAVVNLSSNNAAATVPSSVTVASGTNSKTFTVTTSPVATNQNATITASKSGSSNKTKSLTVKAPVPTSLSLSLQDLQGGNGNTSTGTVTINTPAPTGGINVALSSNQPQAIVPPTVTIPQGATSENFTINTTPCVDYTEARISASYNGTTKSADLYIFSIGVPYITVLDGNGRLGVNFYEIENAESYNIKRSTAEGGPYTLVGTFLAANVVDGQVTYIDNTVTNGTTYYYVVSAVDDGVEGYDSYRDYATPSIKTGPSNLMITSMRGALKLNWTANSDYDDIIIHRGTQPGGPYPTELYGWAQDFFYDTSVEANVTYYYVVECKAGLESFLTSEISSAASSSAVPLQLSNIEEGKIRLSWFTSPAFPYGYFVLRRSTTPGGPYTDITTIPEQWYGQTVVQTNLYGGNYTDESALPDTTYYYVVEGEYFPEWPTSEDLISIPINRSNEVSGIRINTVPPGLPTFSELSWDRVTVTAPALPSWATSLSLQQKLQSEPDENYSTIANNLAGSAVTVVNNLTSKTAYSFRYVAHSSFASTNGSGANVTTKITIPGELTVVDVTGTTVKLKMPSLPGDATSLILERLIETAHGSTSPPTSNMIGWYQADSLTALGNTLVTHWPDSSAAGQHASQQSVDRQPLLVHNAVNGRSIVRFNGTEDLHGNGDFLRMPAGKRNFTNGYSAFAVVKPVNDAGNMAIVDLSNGFNPYSYIRFSRNGLYFGIIPSTGKMHYGIGNSDIWGAGSLEGSGVNSSNFQILGAVQDGGPILVPSNVNLYRNGSRIASGNVPVPEIVERVTNFIGSPSDNQGHSPFEGDIAEVILYDSALSNTHRKQVEEYLSRKYAIGAANAPTGTWATIATGLAGEAIYDDTLLTPETTYWYRTRSTDGVETSEPGPVEMATTLPAAPDAPAAPTFGVETAYTIPVIAPVLPARATHMRLQYKPDGGAYADVADNIKGEATFLVRDLRPGQLYYFRFVAVGRGGETNGAEASHSTTQTDMSGNGTGLRGFYYPFVPNHLFETLQFIRLDPIIDFQWGSGSPGTGIGNSFCVRWIGQIEAQVTGTHTIYFKHGNWDDIKVWVDGQLLINYSAGVPSEHSGTIALTAGEKYDIMIEYIDHAGDGAPDEGYAELRWSCDTASLSKQIIPQSQLYPLLLPDAPGAPVIEDVSATSILVAQPVWPANTSSLSLQIKEARYADDAYVTVASGLLPGEKTTISDLIPQKEYTLRYVAQGFGAGVTANGATVNVWTHPNWPDAPFPPTFLNRSDTTVTVKAPALPANAQTMTLQRSTGDALNYVDVEQGLLGNSTAEVTGLTLGTLYYFRYVAVNDYGVTPGEGRAIKTVTPPGVPPAPVFESVGENSAVVNYIPFPANTSQLRLEWKKTGQPDSAYAEVFTLSWEVTGTREVTGLEAGTEYQFRYVAIGSGDDGFVAPSTPGPATTISTTPGIPTAPEPPDVPTFSNIARNSLTVTMPDLPARAVTLTLQKKLASELDTAYTDVETNLAAYQEVEINGLTAGTDYHFRCVAVNAEGSTAGAAASVTTGDSPPGALGPPTFSTPVYNGVLTASVVVTPPSFPTLTSSLNLEMKEAGEPDTEYQVVDSQILPGQTSLVTGLYNGKTYTFRYVAYGIGGNTPGTPADLTIPALTSLWEVGTPIACTGIVMPDQNITVAGDAEVPLSSAPAHDWDLRVWKLGGVTLGSTRLADPCKYLWSATGGSFKASRIKGQSVTWIAPSAPGTYVITLTVDDQNTLNIGTGDTGSRNDDPALTFTRTIIVD